VSKQNLSAWYFFFVVYACVLPSRRPRLIHLTTATFVCRGTRISVRTYEHSERSQNGRAGNGETDTTFCCANHRYRPASASGAPVVVRPATRRDSGSLIFREHCPASRAQRTIRWRSTSPVPRVADTDRIAGRVSCWSCLRTSIGRTYGGC
jgi:hypothetical protein